MFLVLGVDRGGMVSTGLNRGVLSCSSVLAWGSFECPESAAVHVLCLISCIPSAGLLTSFRFRRGAICNGGLFLIVSGVCLLN